LRPLQYLLARLEPFGHLVGRDVDALHCRMISYRCEDVRGIQRCRSLYWSYSVAMGARGVSGTWPIRGPVKAPPTALLYGSYLVGPVDAFLTHFDGLSWSRALREW
jgi:hypothetical protein